MAKKKETKKKVENKKDTIPEKNIDYKEIINEHKEKLHKQYEQKKDDLKEYKDKAKDNIKEKPIESILIAAGIGTFVGLIMAASAIGMKNMQDDNYKKKFYKAKKNIKHWPDSFEDEIKEKPIQALGLAVGAGILIGALLNYKK